jgi:hypothetical protein
VRNLLFIALLAVRRFVGEHLKIIDTRRVPDPEVFAESGSSRGTIWNYPRSTNFSVPYEQPRTPSPPAESIRNLFAQKTVLSSRGASFPVGCNIPGSNPYD